MEISSDLYEGKLEEARQLRKSAEEYRNQGDYERAWELESSADEAEEQAEKFD